MRTIKNPNLSADDVRALLDYDPTNGVFRWKHRPLDLFSGPHALREFRRWNGRYAERLAGHQKEITKEVFVELLGQTLTASRVAWLVMTGEWPIYEVDHEDCDPGNNKWANLRLATRSQNSANRRRPKNNRSGYKGVSWDTRRNTWRSQLVVAGKRIWLGYFDDPVVAHTAYCQTAERHFANFARGE